MKIAELEKKSIEIRLMIIDQLESSRRGHISPAFSIVEILIILYHSVLKYKPEDPYWEERDRFILSKGHGCMAYYAILASYSLMDKSHLKEFCDFHGSLGGHPERDLTKGIEASSGSLGLGAPLAVGVATALKIKNTGPRVYVLLGDGECNEGSVWEAFMSAAHSRLDNITFIIDYNKMQSYGSTDEVCSLGDLKQKLTSFGLQAYEVDMVQSPLDLISFCESNHPSKPKAIICHTVKGMGSNITSRNLDWHHKRGITDQDIKELKNSVENPGIQK